MIRVFYFCLRVGLEGNKVWSFLVVFIKPLSLWDWGHKMRGCWESWLQLYYRERKFFRQPKSSSFFTLWYLPGNLLRCSVPTHSTLLFYFYCTTCALLLFVLWSSCGLGDSAPRACRWRQTEMAIALIGWIHLKIDLLGAAPAFISSFVWKLGRRRRWRLCY